MPADRLAVYETIVHFVFNGDIPRGHRIKPEVMAVCDKIVDQMLDAELMAHEYIKYKPDNVVFLTPDDAVRFEKQGGLSGEDVEVLFNHDWLDDELGSEQMTNVPN